jgi:hypothetical protein
LGILDENGYRKERKLLESLECEGTGRDEEKNEREENVLSEKFYGWSQCELETIDQRELGESGESVRERTENGQTH